MGEGSGYSESLAEFAQHGAKIISTDARTHYEAIGKQVRRPLEPGYIPVAAPPILTAISYYPNETELPSREYDAARNAFHRWGETGSVEDYTRAYKSWLAFRDQIPFYQRWEAPLFAALGIDPSETAWFPLVKCPLPARTAVDREGMDIFRDHVLLWEQLKIVRPKVILVQGAVVNDVIGVPLDNLDFVKIHALQKIPQFAKSEMKAQQLNDLVRRLEPFVQAERLARTKS